MSKKQIKILLLQNDVKQADIARKLKVSKQAIHNVIKGIAESRRIKIEIARAVGMRIEDIWPNGNDKAA